MITYLSELLESTKIDEIFEIWEKQIKGVNNDKIFYKVVKKRCFKSRYFQRILNCIHDPKIARKFLKDICKKPTDSYSFDDVIVIKKVYINSKSKFPSLNMNTPDKIEQLSYYLCKENIKNIDDIEKLFRIKSSVGFDYKLACLVNNKISEIKK